MSLRVIIAAQVIGVTLVGLLARGTIPVRPSVIEAVPDWFGFPIVLALFAAALASPFFVFRCVSRQQRPAWRTAAVVGIEFALAYAAFLAMLPSVQ